MRGREARERNVEGRGEKVEGKRDRKTETGGHVLAVIAGRGARYAPILLWSSRGCLIHCRSRRCPWGV